MSGRTPPSANVRVFLQQDGPQVYRLWQRAMGESWPLSYEACLHKLLDPRVYQPGDHLVAEVGGTVVGFVATQAPVRAGGGSPRGGLMLLAVDPSFQRRGIGRRLHSGAMAILRQCGVADVQLGAGGLSSFWPGVPTNLGNAWPFFEACRWMEIERSFDLVADLLEYSTPAWVYERVRLPKVGLHVAGGTDSPAVLEFVYHHNPAWRLYYQEVLDNYGPGEIIVAKDESGRIVGASYAMDARREWQRYDFCAWQERLGEEIGGVGPLLVAEDARGNGIGLALAARVTETLKARGLRTSFVNYTWLVDWYGRLGYRVWREYRMSWRTLRPGSERIERPDARRHQRSKAIT